MTDRLTEEQLTDIEIRARDVLALGTSTGGCKCAHCSLASESLSLLAEVRALQKDLDSHARDIARLRDR